MTDWIWTEFVPEDPSCGRKAFECDLDPDEPDVMQQCALRMRHLSERFGPPAQGHGYTEMGPFNDTEYDEHRWFFNLEKEFTSYTQRFELAGDQMQETMRYGDFEAMTLSVFFRETVSRAEFGLDPR